MVRAPLHCHNDAAHSRSSRFQKEIRSDTAKRTTLRSSKGTKLDAVLATDGTSKDIQTDKRARGVNLKRGSAADTAVSATKNSAAKKAKTAKKAVKSVVSKAARAITRVVSRTAKQAATKRAAKKR